MVEWSAIVLPSLIATVLVFVASSVIHMVLKLHNPDYLKLANEEEVRAAIRKGAPAPGQYVMPHCLDSKALGTPEFQAKMSEGPNAILYVGRTGPMQLGPFLGKWVAYTLVVSLLVGYVTRSTMPAGAPYLDVFQIAGVAAWLAYSWQGPADSVWKHKPWRITFRGMFDGLVYALLTAGAFAGFWPEAPGL